ncbi:MAG: hypothetical protein DMD72_06330 [Gemmatimonadetes bacterium]|nr:MAG: hypothetical protein DMD72_06330 [Gemmatimonadota bacterium]
MRYHARWVLPITQPPIENGTVVETDGKITYVGPRTGAPAGKDDDLGDTILLPGLVNTHTHLELTAMRGFLEDLDFADWIDKLRQSRNEILDDAKLLDSAKFGIIEGVEAGITTYADTCSSGVVMQAMVALGVRGIMYQEVFAPDPSKCDAAVRELEERLGSLEPEQTDLVQLGVSPHAPYTVSDPLYAATGQLARKRNLPLAMHIAESAAEEDLVVRGEGAFAERWRRRGIEVSKRARSPIALLEKHEVLEPGSLLIHCVRVDDADITTIARRGCSVAHCPASNAKFGHGVAPLLPMLAAGIPVGIGSDSGRHAPPRCIRCASSPRTRHHRRCARPRARRPHRISRSWEGRRSRRVPHRHRAHYTRRRSLLGGDLRASGPICRAGDGARQSPRGTRQV